MTDEERPIIPAEGTADERALMYVANSAIARDLLVEMRLSGPVAPRAAWSNTLRALSRHGLAAAWLRGPDDLVYVLTHAGRIVAMPLSWRAPREAPGSADHVVGVCRCPHESHPPNHEWSPGRPHTVPGSVRSDIAVVSGEDHGLPWGMCADCVELGHTP